MRCDTPVYFQSVTDGRYNYTSGNYGDDTVTEIMRYAAVTDAREETVGLLYGKLRQGVLVVRLQNHYKADFDYIRIGSKRYHVDFRRELNHKQVFYVTDVL